MANARRCFFVYLQGCVFIAACSGNMIWKQDTTMDNFISTPPVSEPYTQLDGIHSKGTCATLCWHQSGCSSFFFTQSAGRCLLNRYVFDATGVRQSSPGTQYFVSVNDNCPASAGFIWVRGLNLCFKVYITKVNITSAHKTCEDSGMHLISLETITKGKMVFGHVNSNYGATPNFYLGATRVGALDGSRNTWDNIKDPFFWRRGMAVALSGTDSLWYSMEPNNDGNNEGCVAYRHSFGAMIDINCFSNFPFICEKIFN